MLKSILISAFLTAGSMLLAYVPNSINSSTDITDPANFVDPVPFPEDFIYHPLYEKSMAFSKAGQWQEAEVFWIEFSKRYPDADAGYYHTAEARFYQAKYEESLVDFEQGHQMNPMKNGYMLNYLNGMSAFKYEERGAEFGIKMASLTDDGLYNAILTEMDKIIATNGADSPYSAALVTAKAAYISHYAEINSNDGFYDVLYGAMNVHGATVEAVWENFKSLKVLLSNRGADQACYASLLKEFYITMESDNADYGPWFRPKITEELGSLYNELDSKNIYFKTYAGQSLYDIYFGQADFEKASALIDKMIFELSESGLFRFKLLELYQAKARLLFEMDRNKEFQTVATELEKIDLDYKNPGFKARTFEYLALLYKDTDFPKAEIFALRALEIAQTNQMTGRVRLLNSLLSIIYFDNNKLEEGLKFAGVEGDLSKMNSIELFNAASILEDMGNLEKAEDFYLRSLAKHQDEIKDASDRVQLTGRAKMDIVYAGLASTYNKLNKPEKVLEIIERSKAQALSAELGANPVSAKELQNLLGPNEAFVSYKILDPSNFMIVIATNDKIVSDSRSLTSLVNPLKNNFADAFYALDDKLANEMYQQPNFIKPKETVSSQLLNEGDFTLAVEFYRAFLTHEIGDYLPNLPAEAHARIMGIIQQEFYGTFVWPFEQAIEPKSKYYLSLDGELNFLPFETFLDSEGNYLAQKAQYNIITSASILNVVKNRKYNASRKSVLAFGGATYNLPETDVSRVKTVADVNDWQLKSYDLVNNNEPLTDLFSALGYGQMTYLAGTLQEVQDIQTVYADATILTGEEMTEKTVKTMSENGSLKSYKTLHFATHGWVINSLPTVSGLAMCIPTKSVDGEDGRLISNEIAKLDIEADMVMLSACQTGLGKLYGGEGVAGLNQSFIKAGANSTIVSLWPVDDYATSVLVKELYRITKEDQLGYAEALRKVKLNFIAGHYNTETRDLSHPIYWAAFVYNGA